MELIVGPARTPAADELDVEIVERKGLGHPDTLCDALAEELSASLSRHYHAQVGRILHHNVDKVLLRAGVARPAFGGGEVLAPIELYFAGRAALEAGGRRVPVEDLALQGTRAWLRSHLRALDPERHVVVRSLVRPGSADLVALFDRQIRSGVRLANDTSVGVGFAPLTELERLVLAVENRLDAAEVKDAHPHIGEDIKIVGVRRGARIHLDVACALVGRFVSGIDEYLEKKEAIRALAEGIAGDVTSKDVAIEINAADDPAAGDVYLTVTGTSAEAGDDGETGRGNRFGGLITPHRPMSLEAAAGKNPVTHVGKLYQVAAHRIARALVGESEEIAAAECAIVSRIGRPVSDPAVVDVRLRVAGGRAPTQLRDRVEAVVRAELARLEFLWRDVLDGRLVVY